MRLVSMLLPTLVSASLMLAQVPIGLGPGTSSQGVIDSFDWYTATASGCTVGARGMCVGGFPVGDTIYFTGWFASASMLPITNGLPVVGTLNDFTSKTCSGNLMVIQLAAFDWTARNSSRIYEVNCMSDYGSATGAINAPSGWFGHCTNNDDGGSGCSWKSRSAFVRGGLLYLPVERQIPAGTASVHDATLIVSADGGKTWKNPYTVAHGGVASATGDAPKCGAAASGAGNPCTDASYPGSIMWPAAPLGLYTWQAVQYGQDGATPPAGVNDGCDPAIYTCFTGDPTEGTLARVLNTDLPSLDVTKWQYYTCPAITDSYRCPGSDPASWTSVFANRTPAGPATGKMWSLPVTYIKEFKSYLLTGGTDPGPAFATAPTIQGPWDIVAMTNTGFGWGFDSPTLAPGYTVVSTTPPHIKLTVLGDTKLHVSQTSPMFTQWDLVMGRTKTGETPRLSILGGAVTNAGYILSGSHAPGTLPSKDLVWAFDLYDHGGNTAAGITGFHEIVNGSAFLVPCANEGGCGTFYSSKGNSLTTFGASVWDGYGAHLTSMMHETPQTIAIGAANSATSGLTPSNAPLALQVTAPTR
jgi:hypothetical protein